MPKGSIIKNHGPTGSGLIRGDDGKREVYYYGIQGLKNKQRVHYELYSHAEMKRLNLGVQFPIAKMVEGKKGKFSKTWMK